MRKNSIENNEYMRILNDYLPMLRAQAGLNQADIAEIIGIARTTYSAVENKKRKMTFAMFLSLSEYFYNNEKTKNIMEMLGLTEEVLEPFFKVNDIMEIKPKNTDDTRIAAFGGYVSAEYDNEKQIRIDQALKRIREKNKLKRSKAED